MIVGSASASAIQWTKGSEQTVGATVKSFRATAAPQIEYENESLVEGKERISAAEVQYCRSLIY